MSGNLVGAPTVLAAISAHGYGHAAQVSPVINRLRTIRPGTKLVVVSDLPAQRLGDWIAGDFDYERIAVDPGIPMLDPLQVDVLAMQRAYREFAGQSDLLCHRLVRLIKQHHVDLLVADVPWLPLAAARHAGCAAAALCSLNWVDIVEPLLPSDSGLSATLDAMRDAYSGAQLFIQPAPAMPMAWLDNRRSVGHIAAIGNAAGAAIRDRLGLPDDQRLGLLQFGGEAGRVALRLPVVQGLTWLVAGRAEVGELGIPAQPLCDALGLRFVDLVASMDLMLTKPGYGSFAEAVTNGVRLLSVARKAWPEQPWLLAWASRHLPLREIDRERLAAGDFDAEVNALLAAPRPAGQPPVGIAEAAALLDTLL